MNLVNVAVISQIRRSHLTDTSHSVSVSVLINRGISYSPMMTAGRSKFSSQCWT